MLQVLENKKKCYQRDEVPAAKPLSTPEFDKAVLWSKVENNAAFRQYIPDHLMEDPKKLPKEWLWQLINKFDHEFAKKYSKRAFEIANEKKRSKLKGETIKIAEEHLHLLKHLHIQPKRRLLVMPKNENP